MSASMPAASRLGAELGDRPLDVGLAALAPGVEELGQLAEALGLEDLEREVLELPLHLPDAEPLGQRRVDLHRLAGDALLLLGRQAVQRPHVVEPVGELDEDDPDVLGHRQQHLPDVLGLLLLVAVGAELRQLGHAVDELGDLGPNRSSTSVRLYSVSSGTSWRSAAWMAVRVEAEVGEDLGRGDRVGDVRLAGRPPLAVVGVDGEVEGALDRLEVGAAVLGRGSPAYEVGAEARSRSMLGARRSRARRRAAGRGPRFDAGAVGPSSVGAWSSPCRVPG